MRGGPTASPRRRFLPRAVRGRWTGLWTEAGGRGTGVPEGEAGPGPRAPMNGRESRPRDKMARPPPPPPLSAPRAPGPPAPPVSGTPWGTGRGDGASRSVPAVPLRTLGLLGAPRRGWGSAGHPAEHPPREVKPLGWTVPRVFFSCGSVVDAKGDQSPSALQVTSSAPRRGGLSAEFLPTAPARVVPRRGSAVWGFLPRGGEVAGELRFGECGASHFAACLPTAISSISS